MAREEYIRIYRSGVGGATPSLTSGEIATNLVDGKFFIGGTNGSLITFTSNSYNVTSVNSLTGAVSLTGDGGAIYGIDNNKIGARLATVSLTGVASFDPRFFSIGTSGHLVLTGSYQVTGDTVQAGSGIAIGTNKTITNIGVTGIGFDVGDVGLTGKINLTAGSNITIIQSGNLITIGGIAQQTTAVTGDGAAIIGRDNAFVTARVGAYGATGVASFDPRFFGIGTSGHLVLTGSYQVTGDTVQAGSGISIGTDKTITNIGVTGIGFGADTGLTGKINLTAGNGMYLTRSGNTLSYSVKNFAFVDSINIASSNIIGSDLFTITGGTGINTRMSTSKDSISIYSNFATTDTTAGIAWFYGDHFNVRSSDGRVVLANAYQATGDTVQAGSFINIGTGKTINNIGVQTFNSLTGAVSLTGDGGAVVGKENNKLTVRVVTDNAMTGVASFDASHFTVGGTGHVRSKGIITINSAAPDANGNFEVESATVVTGDGGAIQGKGGAFITARLTTAAGATGIASFRNTHFTVDTTGHVQLAAAYQVTGDTVQAGTFINIGAGKTINNIGVQTFNSLTGAVSLTGDSGAIYGIDNSKIGARIATNSLTGVASFSSAYFTVGDSGTVTIIEPSITVSDGYTGSVVIGTVGDAGGYRYLQITGDSSISVSLTRGNSPPNAAIPTLNIRSLGVRSFNGTTGSVSLTGDGGAVYGYGNNGIGARLGSYTLTGVASFDPIYFAVGTSGHLKLATAYQVTGDTVQAGYGINLGVGKVINNTGVTSFNGLTGNVSLTGDGGAVQGKENNKLTVRVVTDNAMTGVASFDASHFTVGGTGHVRSKGIITINSVTADANGNFTVASATVVTGDGGAIKGKGDAFITARLATTEATGVAMFNDDQFSVNEYASVSLIYPYDPTYVVFENTTNVFTSKQYFTAGISADNIFVGSGITSIEIAYRPFQGDLSESPTNHSLIKSNDQGGLYLFSSGGTTASSIVMSNGELRLGSGLSGMATVNIGLAEGEGGIDVPEGAYGSQLRFAASDGNGTTYFALKTPTSSGVENINLTLPSTSGTLALAGSVVTSINGATGSVSLTGDGGAVQGKQNNIVTARLADSSVTGVASFNGTRFTVSAVGAVDLAAAYQATGDTVQAGSGIAIGTNKTITNIGVTGIGFDVGDVGLTGKVNITAGSNITITQSGNTIIIAGQAQQTTAVTGDGAAIIGRDNAFITARLATNTGVTGVASFNSTRFSVSNGAVDLATAYQATGDIIQAGSFINIGAGKTINNIGVQTFNSLTGAVSITGDGGAVQGKQNNIVTARLADSSVTGVASFNSTRFTVSAVGAVDLAAAYQATGDTVITVAGSGIGISTSGKTDTLFNIGVTGIGFDVGDVGLTGKINITAGTGITITRSGNTISFGGAVTGDTAAIEGKENNKITARLASTSLTGVAYFDSSAFIVTDGYVQLNGGGPGGACSDYTTKVSCEANGCVWCEGTQTCVQQFCNLFTAKNNGIGASANANGSLSYLYFDPGNLSAYTSDYSNKKTNYVLVYDESGTGISKARRATLENFFSENSALLKSSTTGQLSNAVKKTNALGTNTIELGVVLGSIAAGQEGLVKGASAFAYITQNTVKSINGATGDVMVVGDINGCTGAIVITGTTNEVVVTNSCPNITIGLPDNVSIPYLSGTGATFTQTVTATRFIGIVSGGDF